MGENQLRIVSAVEAASDALMQDILACNFEPGTKISETMLAEQYGVSRNTIREAIAYLLNSGVLVKNPNRGIFVKQISLDDVREIFHIRRMFETEAVKRIGEMGFISPTILSALNSIEAVDLEHDWAHYVTTDSRFHQALVDSVGSLRLSRMYGMIVSEVQLCIVQSQTLLKPFTSDAYDHRIIIRHLEEGETELAVASLQKHLDSAVERFERAFARGGAGS